MGQVPYGIQYSHHEPELARLCTFLDITLPPGLLLLVLVHGVDTDFISWGSQVLLKTITILDGKARLCIIGHVLKVRVRQYVLAHVFR